MGLDTVKRFSTVKQIADKYPGLTEAALRWHIFNADRNGLNQALIHLGRRVYFDDDRFEQWLASHRG